MNKNELNLRRDLAESNEWDEIRTRLLDLCSEQSASDAFYDKFGRGVLFVVRTVDSWITDYYNELDKERKKEGDN